MVVRSRRDHRPLLPGKRPEARTSLASHRAGFGERDLSPNHNLHKESAEDICCVRRAGESAFGRSGEADLVDALRRVGALVLSVAAALDDTIVGQVAFSLGCA